MEFRSRTIVQAEVRLFPLRGGEITLVEVRPEVELTGGLEYYLRPELAAGRGAPGGFFTVVDVVDTTPPAPVTAGTPRYVNAAGPNPCNGVPYFSVALACAAGETGYIEVVIDGTLDQVRHCDREVQTWIGRNAARCDLSSVALGERHIATFTVVDPAGNRSPPMTVVLERPEDVVTLPPLP